MAAAPVDSPRNSAPVARKRRAALYLACALLIAIPCVWQPHIQAGDLSSHLYNAWLANQVASGRLHGLYIVPQFTNVLFDHLLSLLLKTGSVVLSERIAVVAAVQIFFWGCFAFVSAASDRPAWAVAPFLAMLAYGAVFRLGFFNFYISVGLCLLAVALLWRSRGWIRLAAFPLALAAFAAHYLPMLWAAALLGYALIARRLKPGQRRWLLGSFLAAIAALAGGLAFAVPSRWTSGIRIDSMFGTDQLLTWGVQYKFVDLAAHSALRNGLRADRSAVRATLDPGRRRLPAHAGLDLAPVVHRRPGVHHHPALTSIGHFVLRRHRARACPNARDPGGDSVPRGISRLHLLG